MTISYATVAAVLFFPAVMIWAALMDLTTMTIRNRLVLMLLAGYAVLAPFVGLGLAEIGFSVAIAAAVLLSTFALFSFGWLGGGDAKLAAATALWLGADHTLVYLVYTALIGGLLAAALLVFRCAMLPQYLRRTSWSARLHSPQVGLPYGVAMAPAALLVFPSTHWLMTI